MALIPCPDPDCGKRVSDQAAACPHCGHPISGRKQSTSSQRPNVRPGVVDSAYSQEVSFYSDERGVRITNTRAIIENRTYSMANISSVMLSNSPPNRTGPLVFILLGIFAVVFSFLISSAAPPSAGLGFGTGGGGGMAAPVSRSDLSPVTITLGVGVGMLVIGFLWMMSLKTTYSVEISSAGGESTALSTKNKEYAELIVGALNEAIVRRG